MTKTGRLSCAACLLAALHALSLRAADESDGIVFQDGDRVVLVGNTFIERAQTYGHLQTWFTARWPDRQVSFRNLGWSGDTVYGDARSYFGPPEEGFERLQSLLAELTPTVIISAYGSVAAFEGEAGLPNFLQGYRRLLDAMEKTGARIILFTPPPLENLPTPLPNQDAQNERIALYANAICSLAEERGLSCVDVFRILGGGAWADYRPPLTEDGMHFTEAGYAKIAPLIAKAMGMGPLEAFGFDLVNIFLLLDVTNPAAPRIEGPTKVDIADDGTIAMTIKPHTLLEDQEGLVRIAGLSEGRYRLEINGHPYLTATAETWARGLQVTLPVAGQLETLRQTIVEKDRLFFHRWRPQNETYLFGFRKHEQGNNAVEVAQFDPLIAAKEEEIAALRRPPVFQLTLTPVDSRR